MDDKKTKYWKEYYLKNMEKLIEYGKKYYNERIYPNVEIEVKQGNLSFILTRDYFYVLSESSSN